MAEKDSASSRQQSFYATAEERIRQGDAAPGRRGISLEDAMSSEEYLDYKATDADSISDEVLFD